MKKVKQILGKSSFITNKKQNCRIRSFKITNIAKANGFVTITDEDKYSLLISEELLVDCPPKLGDKCEVYSDIRSGYIIGFGFNDVIKHLEDAEEFVGDVYNQSNFIAVEVREFSYYFAIKCETCGFQMQKNLIGNCKPKVGDSISLFSNVINHQVIGMKLNNKLLYLKSRSDVLEGT